MSLPSAAPTPAPLPPSPIARLSKRRSSRLPTAVWLLWAAGAAALLLIVVSLVYCLAFLPTLLSAGEPGFRWDYNARTRQMRVTSVAPGSPAAAAGLRAGMRIVAIGGRE